MNVLFIQIRSIDDLLEKFNVVLQDEIILYYDLIVLIYEEKAWETLIIKQDTVRTERPSLINVGNDSSISSYNNFNFRSGLIHRQN